MKIYSLFWKEIEQKYPLPRKSRNIIEIDFKRFEKIINNNDENEVKKLIKNLYFGDFYLLKGAFQTSFLERIKKECFNYFSGTPSSFHKMLEGTPDFQRKIDLDLGKKYSFARCSHSFYFYRWNNDPINLFDEIDKKMEISEKINGIKL